MKKGHNRAGGIAGEELNSIIQRIERLEDEKAGIAQDIREVYAESKGRGFDPKTIREIIKIRKMSQSERDEREALLDIYKAALGMLGGTPLGEAAIRRLTRGPSETPEDGAGDEGGAEPTTPDQSEPHPDIDLDKAREMARKAAAEGRPVTDNPFTARDPRRAAWDEEWCRSTGRDGMELPDAWKRSPKKKDA
jgi:uncharacterized protein (UPF0335 family)